MLWGVLSIIAAGAVALGVWRLGVQKEQEETNSKVVALLASADKLITENRDDEAEAEARKGLALMPGDVRCNAMIERVQKKRDMIRKDREASSGFAMTRAKELEKENLQSALDAYMDITRDETSTKEAKQAAEERAKELREGVCTLLLPDDWPADGEIKINSSIRNTAKKKVEGIGLGKQVINISRPGYRSQPPVELDFRTVEPLRLPSFQWKLKGATVFIVSKPAGAEVWIKGVDTGKKTPCEFEDVDEGAVSYQLKHPKHGDVFLSGKVEGRLPLRLSADFFNK
jgi:hypothetical protein